MVSLVMLAWGPQQAQLACLGLSLTLVNLPERQSTTSSFWEATVPTPVAKEGLLGARSDLLGCHAWSSSHHQLMGGLDCRPVSRA